MPLWQPRNCIPLCSFMRFVEYHCDGEAAAQQGAEGSVQEESYPQKESSICIRQDMQEVRAMRAMYGVSNFCISTLGAPDYIDTESGNLLETPCFGVKSHESLAHAFAAEVCGS